MKPNPNMIVPDEAANRIASFGLSERVFCRLMEVIDKYVPQHYPELRKQRPADHEDELFVYQRIMADVAIIHVFTMFFDDASATDHFFYEI
jgi:hypothetical protein